ncbi:putative transposable element [Trichonephila clavipes]|nr:putative transposable element [Trichonephila clavipes]
MSTSTNKTAAFGVKLIHKCYAPLHPEKLKVWGALWAGGIIGPYFFKNDEGHNVTVNGDRYRAMITNFFIPELNNHDVQELWFQQDGATCHTARATIDLLKTRLSLVYADNPQTLDNLEDNIRRVIADIRPQMLEKVIENWTYRLDYIRASRGSPMPEIIFKIVPTNRPNHRKAFILLIVQDFSSGDEYTVEGRSAKLKWWRECRVHLMARRYTTGAAGLRWGRLDYKNSTNK